MSSKTLDSPVPQVELSRLYLDFDSFFASAEQHFNPSLRGRAIGVVPLDVLNTGCIAISREAKACGVPSGASVAAARAILPDMAFVVARPDAYVRLHHRILAVVESCVPIAQVRSIDELVCHLLQSEAEQPEHLIRRIKVALAAEFSDGLTCSIGIAQSELLAKIAAEMNKPDGSIILRPGDLPQKISHLKLTEIPGVSSGIEKRLIAAGIEDVAAFWQIGSKHARALWGSIEGERVWNGLHGLHYVRPETLKRTFGHSRMLPLDWRTPSKVYECARQLVLSAGRRLRRTDVKATKMTLSVRGGGYRREDRRKSDDLRWNKEVSFASARDDLAFLKALDSLAKQYREHVQFSPRSVSVMLHGLVDREDVQADLFECNGTVPAHGRTDKPDAKKREKISDTIDKLRLTFGPAAASLGPSLEMPGGYLGAKIAFGRIPEEADFSGAQTKDEATHFYTAGRSGSSNKGQGCSENPVDALSVLADG